MSTITDNSIFGGVETYVALEHRVFLLVFILGAFGRPRGVFRLHSRTHAKSLKKKHQIVLKLCLKQENVLGKMTWRRLYANGSYYPVSGTNWA